MRREMMVMSASGGDMDVVDQPTTAELTPTEEMSLDDLTSPEPTEPKEPEEGE
jgi:hypothetical protein